MNKHYNYIHKTFTFKSYVRGCVKCFKLSDIPLPRILDCSVAVLGCSDDVMMNLKLHINFLATSLPENCHNL